MADNVLSGRVQITAPGVENTFNSVAKSVSILEGQLLRLNKIAAGDLNFKQLERVNSLIRSTQSNISSLNKLSGSFQSLGSSSNSATLSLTNVGRIMQDLPYGIQGVANNLNPFVEGFQRLVVQTGSAKLALKALGSSLLGAGGIGFAVSLASSALIVFGDKLFGASKAAKEAKSEAEKLKDAIEGIFAGTAKEAAAVAGFVAVLKSETETRERRLGAIQELQKIQPEIFKGLKLEGDAVVGLDAAYQNYLANLKNIIAAKIIQAKLEQKIEQLLKAQGVGATDTEKRFNNLNEIIKKIRVNAAGKEGGEKLGDLFKGQDQKAAKVVDNIQNDIDGLFKDLQEFEKFIKIDKPLTVKPKIKIDKLDKIEFPVAIDPQFRFETGFKEEEFIGRFRNFAKEFLQPNETFKVKFNISLSAKQLEFREAQAKLIAAAKELAKSFNDAIQTGFSEGFASIGEGIGNLLSGKEFGTQLFQVFGSLLESIGKALIKFGIVKTGIDKILSNPIIPGGVALGLGIFAIAAGQLIKNIKGARALGGPVQAGGTYLVGEKGPELFKPNTGGSIIPNNQLSGRGSSVNGGVMVQVAGQFVQRGQDLLAVITLANQSKSRLQ